MESNYPKLDDNLGDFDNKLKVLLTEYQVVAQEIKERLGRSDKIMGFGLTVLVACVAYGLKENIDIMFIFAPLVFFGIIYYAIVNTTAVLTLGGHKKYLGDKINELFHEKLIIWEEIAKEMFHDCFAAKCLYFLFAIFLVVLLSISFFRAVAAYHWGVFLMLLLVTIYFVITWIIAYRKMKNVFKASYDLSDRCSEKK